MKIKVISLLLGVIFLSFVWIAPAFGLMSSLSFRIPAQSIDSGGEISFSESFYQRAVVGQSTAIGFSQSQNFYNQAGFIPQLSALMSLEEITINLSLPRGWSMISLPVDTVDKRISTLLPKATAAFEFTTQYEPLELHEELEIGKGYWVYLPDASTYSVRGKSVNSYLNPNAGEGWSMIGSCSFPSIPSVTNGSIRAVFGFHSRYNLYGHDTEIEPLEPGKGFWINLSDPSELEVKCVDLP